CYHVDFRDVVEEAFAQAKYLAGRRSIAASASLGEKSIVIHADARLLGAAILEICVNAFRFARSEIRVNLSDNLLLIEDDGPGFRSQPTAPGEGLGTSLRMAARVIDAHGGKLEQRMSTLPKRCDTPGAGIAIAL
ncbi:MAG: ATP-binding protein, partial [Polyangiaceae bacterium]